MCEFNEETEYDNDIQLIPSYVYRDGLFAYYNFIGILDDDFVHELNWETTDYLWLSIDKLCDLDNKHFGLTELLNDKDSMDIIKKYAK